MAENKKAQERIEEKRQDILRRHDTLWKDNEFTIGYREFYLQVKLLLDDYDKTRKNHKLTEDQSYERRFTKICHKSQIYNEVATMTKFDLEEYLITLAKESQIDRLRAKFKYTETDLFFFENCCRSLIADLNYAIVNVVKTKSEYGLDPDKTIGCGAKCTHSGGGSSEY